MDNLQRLWLAGNRLTEMRPQQDRAVLVALYEATDGAQWSKNASWLSDAPLGSWHGVSTDANGRVTELDLSENNLTGALPAELGQLGNLEELDLSEKQADRATTRRVGEAGQAHGVGSFRQQPYGADATESDWS